MDITIKEIFNFFNSQFISSILGSAVGASMTFYFVNKRDSKLLQFKNEQTLNSTKIIIIELEDNMNRLVHHSSSENGKYEYISKYWDKYQQDIKQFYPKLHADYCFFLLNIIAFIESLNSQQKGVDINFGRIKFLAMGYRLITYFGEPTKDFESLSSAFPPRPHSKN